jgi:hypothetical protein
LLQDRDLLHPVQVMGPPNPYTLPHCQEICRNLSML